MSHIMPDPVVYQITPDLLFAALLLTVQPEPAVEYAVRIPFDDFGPNVLFVDMTDDRSLAEAALGSTLDGVLVQRASTSAAWTEVVR